jgi:hypothetical protein
MFTVVGRRKDVFEIEHPYLNHEKLIGKKVTLDGVQGRLYTIRVPIENTRPRDFFIDPYMEIFVKDSSKYEPVVINGFTLDTVKWLPTGIPDIGTVSSKKQLLFFPPPGLHMTVPGAYLPFLMTVNNVEDRVIIDHNPSIANIDIIELADTFKSHKHPENGHEHHEVTFNGQRGYWYEAHFASELVKVTAGHDTSHGHHHHWRTQIARAHAWPIWVFVPKTSDYKPIEVHPSKTTVHIQTDEHEEIVRKVPDARYLFYPPYRAGQVVSDDLRKWIDHKIKETARTVKIVKKITYPKEDTIDGVHGFWHLIHFPAVMFDISAGSGEIKGVKRKWRSQKVIGHFKDIQKFIPLTEVYMGVSLPLPPTVSVQVQLESSSKAEQRIWETEMETPLHFKFVFFPLPLGHQVIPLPLESVVDKSEEGQRVWQMEILDPNIAKYIMDEVTSPNNTIM